MRHAITAGWLAGMILILACLPLPAAYAAPLASAGAVLAWRRWSRNLQALARLAPDLLRLRKKARETGRTLERA